MAPTWGKHPSFYITTSSIRCVLTHKFLSDPWLTHTPCNFKLHNKNTLSWQSIWAQICSWTHKYIRVYWTFHFDISLSSNLVCRHVWSFLMASLFWFFLLEPWLWNHKEVVYKGTCIPTRLICQLKRAVPSSSMPMFQLKY